MFHLVVVLAVAVAAQQGQAVRLSFPHEPGIQKAEIRWREKTIPYTHADPERLGLGRLQRDCVFDRPDHRPVIRV